MTLVYREEKKEVFQPNLNQLGPGYYKFPQPTALAPSLVPFSSTIQRNLFQESEFAVGPGFYETEKKMITKQNPTGCVFKSQIQRFRRSAEDILQDENKGSLKLKVGEEEFESSRYAGGGESEMKKADKMSKLSTIDQRLKKVKTIPSIPTIKQSFGYQMNQDNELVLNKNPRDVMSKLDEMRNKKKAISPKGINWSKSKQQRKPFQVSQNGFYFKNAKVSWESKAFKYCDSSQITSETRKLALLKLRYGEKFQDYFEDQKQNNWIYKKVVENNPGPGHYFSKQGNNKSQQKQKQDCFGSSAERFSYNRLKSKNSKNEQNHKHISYHSPNQQQQQTKRLTNLPVAERFHIIGNHQTPGPGAYVQKQTLKQSNKFGKQNRFCSKKIDQAPGPGFYCQTTSKVSNFQKFNSPNNQGKQSILIEHENDKQHKLNFMISSTGDFEQALHRQKVHYQKPQFTSTFQQSLVTVKKTLKQIVNTQENVQEIKTKQNRSQGKLQKPKIPLHKKKPQKKTLGPGCYYKQLPYGKGTFNVTYT